ncbi:MAG TPA: VWA domain-containing protein [Pyrinomonadaceae bacterium]|nr:VWA domain-containing protein [Pyrinomonadaceae bacterium]
MRKSVTIGIVVDNSGSYRPILERVIASVNTIIDDLKEGDEAFLVTFVDTPKISLRQEMTSDKVELKDAVENMYVEGGSKSLLDAVMFAARYLSEQGNSGSEVSRALILISDGDERQSDSSVDKVVSALKDAKIRLFVLGLHDERFHTKVVDRLTKDTGGAKFVPKIPRDAPAAVASMLASIRER